MCFPSSSDHTFGCLLTAYFGEKSVNFTHIVDTEDGKVEMVTRNCSIGNEDNGKYCVGVDIWSEKAHDGSTWVRILPTPLIGPRVQTLLPYLQWESVGHRLLDMGSNPMHTIRLLSSEVDAV
jgi:hypothetical protein